MISGVSGEGDRERILLFGRESVGDWIGFSRKIYVDGTFSLSPPGFYQIVAILAERGGFVIPVCYALLPDKEEASYNRMITLIRTAWPALEPEAISMDFEMGFINAFSAAFPGARLHGCLFHLLKNLKKKLAKLNLISRYKKEASFALSARMITALSFVPPHELDNAIAELAVVLPDELMPVLKYFEDKYVGALLRIRPDGSVMRNAPRYSIDMWSVYERTLNGDSRTNNFAEAAHRRLQTEFGVAHPNIWRFIDTLKKVQHHRDMLLARFEAGNLPVPKRRKYRETDERL